MLVMSVKEKCVVALASLALTLGLFQQMMRGEEPAAKPEAKPAVKARAKPRGRLPAHFGKIVDPQQKETIYKLQAEYAPKIEALRAELQALLAKRDAELESVLTAEQKEKLAEFRAAAASKRGAGAKQRAAQDASKKADASEKASASEKKPEASAAKSS